MDWLYQFLVCVMVGILLLMVVIIKFNDNYIAKQIKNGRYYSIETKGFLLFLILSLFILCLYIPFFIILLTGEFIPMLLIILLIITLVFIIAVYFFIKEKNKFNKNKEEILRNGNMVDGLVVDQLVEESRSTRHSHKMFYMIVEYMDNGEKKQYITP